MSNWLGGFLSEHSSRLFTAAAGVVVGVATVYVADGQARENVTKKIGGLFTRNLWGAGDVPKNLEEEVPETSTSKVNSEETKNVKDEVVITPKSDPVPAADTVVESSIKEVKESPVVPVSTANSDPIQQPVASSASNSLSPQWKVITPGAEDANSFVVQLENGLTVMLTSKKVFELNGDAVVNPIGENPNGKDGRAYSQLIEKVAANILDEKIAVAAQKYNKAQGRAGTPLLTVGESFETASYVAKNSVQKFIHFAEPKGAETTALAACYANLLAIFKRTQSNTVVALPLGPECNKEEAANIFKEAIVNFTTVEKGEGLHFILTFSQEKDPNDIAIYKKALETLISAA